MSMIVKNEGNSEIKQLDPGVYTGIASAIIDIGVQENSLYGKMQRKVMIVWNIVGETVKINDEEKPRVISKEYTMSLSEKSTLRRDLQAWRGKTFTAEELQGFDLKNILNVPCQLQINQDDKNGKTYTVIAAIMAIPKGMKVEKLENTYVFDTYDTATWVNYDLIPNWVKEKIKKAMNLAETELDMYIKDYEEQKKELEGKAIDISNTVKTETEDANYSLPNDDLPF